MRKTIVVAGALAQRPNVGGHTWVLLQYLLGFKRLGWDVLFLDRLDPGMCVDHQGQNCRFEESESRRYFLDVMAKFGLQESFSLDYNRGEHVLGRSRRDVITLLREAGMLLNVMGYLEDEDLLSAARERVFLDIDPGFGQMWQTLGLCQMFQGHDHYVTIGSNIGRPECSIPMCGTDWITTPQPVVLDLWPCQPVLPRGKFTSIVSWRGPFEPVNYAGQRYGLRAHEFRKFMELPQRTNQNFELALSIHPTDTSDIARLNECRWTRSEPELVAYDPASYQHYVQDSWGEFMVAKEMYVKTRSGWVSDRTICYLASGRPAVVQDTGIKRLYPTSEGMIAFTTLEEAVGGVEAIAGNYAQHARAARDIAEAYFDSDKVLMQLLSKLGIA